MSKIVEVEMLNDEPEIDEVQEMGSLNHSMVQGQINGLLFSDKRFRVMPKLSIDVGSLDLSPFGLKAKKELIPDICLYPKDRLKKRVRDLLKVS